MLREARKVNQDKSNIEIDLNYLSEISKIKYIYLSNSRPTRLKSLNIDCATYSNILDDLAGTLFISIHTLDDLDLLENLKRAAALLTDKLFYPGSFFIDQEKIKIELDPSFDEDNKYIGQI